MYVSSISSTVSQCAISENISTQSLLWEWCIANETQNTVTCECSNARNIYPSSFFFTLPKVLVLLTDRVYENGEVNNALMHIDSSLYIDKLIAGDIYEKNWKYTLAVTINHFGSNINSGHYACCLISNGDEAVKCNDTKLLPGSSDQLLRTERLRRNTRLKFYVIDLLYVSLGSRR